MNIRRFLRPESIRLELRTRAVPEDADPKDFDRNSAKNRARIREEVMQELTELFERTGEVGNPNRFYLDLLNRDKRGGTTLGSGIVVPHVRTMRVRSFVMVFGRSSRGLPYDTPDDEPARLFFGLAAPPYDDKTYLKVYQTLAEILLDPEHYQAFLDAEEPSEVIRALQVIG